MTMSRKISICFVGLYEQTNLGDPILAQCTEWLYQNHLSGFDVQTQHICLNKIDNRFCYKPNKKDLLVLRFCKMLPVSERLKERLKGYYCCLLNKRFFYKQLKDVDCLVVTGGGLVKYKYEFFWNSLYSLIRVAEKKNVPVLFNAVGIEGYDNDNYKCRQLKKCLNNKIIRQITVRDDIETLVNCYFDGHPKIPCYAVADSAVWSSDCYGVKRNNKDSNKIGLCVARGNLFQDNGLPFSSNQLEQLYVEIAKDLLTEGYEVVIFTNGANCDRSMAIKVGDLLKDYSGSVNVWLPDVHPITWQGAQGLISKIASLKAVVATRMHTCIISYSLGVPCVGLVWNDKLFLWGKNIKQEANFLKCCDLMPNKVVEQLKIAMYTEIDESYKLRFKNTVSDSIKSIITEYIITK